MMLRLVPKILCLTIMLGILLGGTAVAVEDPIDLLPRDHEVGSWAKDGPDATFFSSGLDKVLGDNVHRVVLDYGFVSLISQYYVLDTARIEVRIYEMESPEQAYGLYSVFSDIEPKFEGPGIALQENEITKAFSVPQEMRIVSDDEVYLVGDNYFVWLYLYETGHPIDVIQFANKIQAKFDAMGGSLSGIKPLERDDKIYGSERLIGGYNALGLYLQIGYFDPFLLGREGVKCVQADYRLKVGKLFRQIVISYPDEDVSKEAYDSFRNWVEDFNYLKRVNYADSLGSIVAENENRHYLAGFRDGLYLRVFYGFDTLGDLKTVLAGYMRRT